MEELLHKLAKRKKNPFPPGNRLSFDVTYPILLVISSYDFLTEKLWKKLVLMPHLTILLFFLCELPLYLGFLLSCLI